MEQKIKLGTKIEYSVVLKRKVKKIRQLLEIQKRHDYVFFVDDEIEYLEYAWIFGIQTYHWNGREIKYFSIKSK